MIEVIHCLVTLHVVSGSTAKKKQKKEEAGQRCLGLKLSFAYWRALVCDIHIRQDSKGRLWPVLGVLIFLQ